MTPILWILVGVVISPVLFVLFLVIRRFAFRHFTHIPIWRCVVGMMVGIPCFPLLDIILMIVFACIGGVLIGHHFW